MSKQQRNGRAHVVKKKWGERERGRCGKHACRKIGRHTDRQTERERERETDRQTDRHTERERERY
jgi:hypothetical protein